eukprot:4334216-Pyramimonas_sp.AAC.1
MGGRGRRGASGRPRVPGLPWSGGDLFTIFGFLGTFVAYVSFVIQNPPVGGHARRHRTNANM